MYIVYNILNGGTMNKGLLVVISGPSGVGKGTIISKFINDPSLNIYYSISMTSRKPRKGEIDNVHYNFISKEQFKKYIQEDKFLEWACFVDNYYGTPIDIVQQKLDQGINVILEIEVEGASIVKEKRPDCLTIFITPPSIDDLKNRIEKRSTEAFDLIQQRLEKAKKELKQMHNYKYVVCNDDPFLAADIIKLIIQRSSKSKLI